MIYLREFNFASKDAEESWRFDLMETCYDTAYPFTVLSEKGLFELEFEPLTILYGSNGSGKTTALNIIAEKIGAERDSLYNKSSFYNDYLKLCAYNTITTPKDSKIITSDDVFDFMLNLRGLNEGIDSKRDDLFNEYIDAQHSNFQMKSLDDYDQLKKVVDARRLTFSKFVRKNMMGNVREHSNGESAFLYFTGKIKENGIYFLDEPENSLSPERQMELAQFLEDSIRFYGCQIIMATHSPFMLAMKGAKIYDLDEEPPVVKKWTELPNVNAYFNFFQDHKDDFIG